MDYHEAWGRGRVSEWACICGYDIIEAIPDAFESLIGRSSSIVHGCILFMRQ